MISRFREWWMRACEQNIPPHRFVRNKLGADLPLIVGPHGKDMFDVWEAEGRSRQEQEDAQRYFLTDEQVTWLDEHAFLDRDVVSITRNDDLWHGFHGEKPELNNNQALWLSWKKVAAESYQNWGGLGDGGVIHVRPLGEIKLITSAIGVCEFVKEFDEGWGLDHDHFSRRLHAWATMRELPGIVDSAGDVVLFWAADLIEEIC